MNPQIRKVFEEYEQMIIVDKTNSPKALLRTKLSEFASNDIVNSVYMIESRLKAITTTLISIQSTFDNRTAVVNMSAEDLKDIMISKIDFAAEYKMYYSRKEFIEAYCNTY